MEFDIVFDVQHAYRKIVHAFAYPGEVVSLKEEADKLDLPLSCEKGIQVLLYMLLDADTSFHVVSGDEGLKTNIARLTYSTNADMSDAAFVIVTKDQTKHLDHVMNQVNVGTLEDPHLGATLLVECDSLFEKDTFTLTGPGIQETNTLHVSLSNDWVETRRKINEEFP